MLVHSIAPASATRPLTSCRRSSTFVSVTATKVTEKFGERLKALRERANVSQTELAKVVQLSKAIIARWEQGETSPTLENMHRVAAFFGVTLSELVGEEPDEGAALRQAEALLQQWSPALATIRQVVHAAAARKREE